jgi:hypothetical protein
MKMKTWVMAKQDLDVLDCKGLVPKGEIGYVKRNAHIKEENGDIQFPQTVYPFPLELLDIVSLPTVDESLNQLSKFYDHSVVSGKGWFSFPFSIDENKVLNYFKTLPNSNFYVRKYKSILKDLVNQMFDPNFDDASFKNDFSWINKWKYSNDKIYIQHQDKKTIADISRFSKEKIIDLIMDIQLISKKLIKSCAETEEWLQTREICEIYNR